MLKINKELYHLADALAEKTPIFFKGCRNSRAIVEKKDISENEYCFCCKKDGKWVVTDGKSKKFDKLFIKQTWIEKNVPEFSGEEYDVKMAPPTIDLEEEEQFHDDNGNIVEIETRGERKCRKCYFLVKDVAAGFGMKKLHDNIMDIKRSAYDSNVHYVYFNCTTIGNSGNQVVKKCLFLTYEGLLKVLFSSRVGNASKFIAWSTETLFAAQLGTKKQKQKLTAKLLGVETEAVKQVFNKNVKSVPSIYLFSLGTVAELRESMSIPSSYNSKSIVYKYGRSEDLEQRTKEHEREYEKKIDGVSLRLEKYAMVDPQYVTEAENDVRDFMKMNSYHISYKNYAELVILDKKQLARVEKEYEKISTIYGGHISELKLMIEKLKNENKLLIAEHKNDKLEDKNKMLLYENQITILKAELRETILRHENEQLRKLKK